MCGLFKWKRICAIFILFVYIWIGIGDPVITVGGLDPIDWFNLTTFLCLSQCYMGLGSFLCSVICGEISINFRSQMSDYRIMKDSNLMSRMFYYNMLKMCMCSWLRFYLIFHKIELSQFPYYNVFESEAVKVCAAHYFNKIKHCWTRSLSIIIWVYYLNQRA